MKKILRHPLFLSLLLIGVIIFLNSRSWFKPPQDFVAYLLSPVQKISYQASLKFNRFINFISSIYYLEQDKTRLEQENQGLLGEVVYLKQVEQENEFLRKQINLAPLKTGQLVLANVIGLGSSSLEKSILIDKGEKDGVEKGMVIISAGNLLVGRIIETTGSFSRVLLIIDADSRVNVKINEVGAMALLRGDGEQSLLIDLVPVEKEIKEGQLIITSGLEGVFPDGLLVGRVKKIISVDVQPFQKAEVEPVLDFRQLEKVFVVIGS